MSDLADWVKWVVHANREDGDITLEQLTGDQFDREELAALYLEAQTFATAAGKVREAVASALLEKLDKPVRVDDKYLVWAGQKQREVCVDVDGFSEWLEGNPSLAFRIFNPNTVKKGSLPEAVRSTFFEKQKYGIVEVQAAPLEVLEK